jgi:ATP-binding cassette subfamily C (CFTR/MRP) protein 1
LSGGQRQRICLARAAYDKSSEIVLLDDPLSAVDAHVGHHLLHQCILSGPLAERTRILVTHHLDVLPRADLVVVMDRDDQGVGRIIQQGTYAALREQEGVFQTLMNDFGSTSTGEDDAKLANPGEEGEEEEKPKVAKSGGGKLLLDEERELGAVSWRVYAKYGKAMGSWPWIGLIGTFLVLTQAANVGNSLFLGFWSGSEINGFGQGDYMGIYAGQSLFYPAKRY